MALFDFFKKNKKKFVEIYSPLNGQAIPLEEIPDEAFSSKIIGDGVGINPEGDTMYAPCDSSDISIFDTNHAISFETKDGLEVIVHFGVDTVKLEGKGFERIANDGDIVKIGSPLLKFDLDFIKKNAKSHKTPIIISNMEMVEKIERYFGDVKVGDLLMKVYLKK